MSLQKSIPALRLEFLVDLHVELGAIQRAESNAQQERRLRVRSTRKFCIEKYVRNHGTALFNHSDAARNGDPKLCSSVEYRRSTALGSARPSVPRVTTRCSASSSAHLMFSSSSAIQRSGLSHSTCLRTIWLL